MKAYTGNVLGALQSRLTFLTIINTAAQGRACGKDFLSLHLDITDNDYYNSMSDFQSDDSITFSRKKKIVL